MYGWRRGRETQCHRHRRRPAKLLDQCRSLTKLYDKVDAQVMVTDNNTNNTNIAYGCAAAAGIDTLDRSYDRRGWLLEAAATHRKTRVLVQGYDCKALSAWPEDASQRMTRRCC
jgi:hypothetical protein